MECVEIRLLSIDDYTQTSQILKEQFARYEPPARFLQVDPDDWMDFLKPVVEECLKSGLSFGAFDKKTGAMIGITVNYIGTKTPQPDLHTERSLPVKQWSRILAEGYPMGAKGYLGTSNYLEMYLVTVVDGHGKNGLGTKLTKRVIEKARQLGCEFMIAFCTSSYTKRMVEKLSFKVVRDVPYADFIDPFTNERVLTEMAKSPHDVSTLMALKL